jgi:hypothetical protein
MSSYQQQSMFLSQQVYFQGMSDSGSYLRPTWKYQAVLG